MFYMGQKNPYEIHKYFCNLKHEVNQYQLSQGSQALYVIIVKEWEFPSNIRRSIYFQLFIFFVYFNLLQNLHLHLCIKRSRYILNEDELCNLMVFCCMFALQSAYYKWLYWMSYWIFIDFACCILFQLTICLDTKLGKKLWQSKRQFNQS